MKKNWVFVFFIFAFLSCTQQLSLVRLNLCEEKKEEIEENNEEQNTESEQEKLGENENLEDSNGENAQGEGSDNSISENENTDGDSDQAENLLENTESEDEKNPETGNGNTEDDNAETDENSENIIDEVEEKETDNENLEGNLSNDEEVDENENQENLNEENNESFNEKEPDGELTEEITEILPEPKKRSWTVMVYMAGDNELESYAIQDINEMESVFEEDNDVSVITLLDRNPGFDGTNENWSDTRLLEIKRDNGGRNGTIVSERLACENLDLSLESETDLDLGNPYTLSGFIDFCKEKYPADKYCLFFWGHGSGWRGYSIDDSSNSNLSLQEIERGIKNKGLDVIVFDSSYGMSVETLYQIKNETSYVCGTAGLSSIYGLNYDYFLQNLYVSEKTESEFIKAVIDSSVSTKFNVIQKDHITEIIDNFEKFSETLANYITSASKRDEVWNKLFTKVKSYRNVSYPCDLNIEIKSFAEQFLDFINSSIRQSAQKLYENMGDLEISVHLIPLVSQNLISSCHSTFYKKNNMEFYSTEMFCAYIDFSEYWVPGNNEKSLLDKLFYKVFE